MKSLRITYLLVALLLAAGGNALAQEVSFTASVDQSTVGEGQQFQITYTLSGGELRNYSNFSQPNLNKDFLTLAGPSSSQQMSIINGKVSASISWIYVLQPRNKGSYTIPAATLNYDGNTLRSNPVKITVVASSANTGGGRQSGQSDEAADVDLGNNLMLLAIPDKREAYIGEPIRVTYKLYSRVDFQLENIVKIPRSVGFWSEELEAPRQLQRNIETYNGRQYQTFLVRKVVYFPTQTGKLFIEPFEINSIVAVRVKRQSGDTWRDRFFSDPFFDSYKNVRKTISSAKLGITVKPLPESGKPASFTGAVGKYSMDVTLDRAEAKANETLTLDVAIRGTGNIKLLSEPQVTIPSGVDKYEPQILEDYAPESGTINGKKSFEYILIPRFPGKVTIPPVEFSYFDLDKKQYVTLSSDEFDLDIAEGKAISEENIPHSQRVKYLSMDIKPLKGGMEDIRRRGDAVPGMGMMAAMYGLPLVFALVGIAWKRRYDRIHGDVTGLRMRRASRTAEKHLAASKKYLTQNDTNKYYHEIAKALWGYIQHRLNIPTSETSIPSVIRALESRNVGLPTIEATQDALRGIEYARFSPTRSEHAEMIGLYDSAKTAIVSIEQELRG